MEAAYGLAQKAGADLSALDELGDGEKRRRSAIQKGSFSEPSKFPDVIVFDELQTCEPPEVRGELGTREPFVGILGVLAGLERWGDRGGHQSGLGLGVAPQDQGASRPMVRSRRETRQAAPGRHEDRTDGDPGEPRGHSGDVPPH